MSWPGRGRSYQSSQAWMFATPEEVHGKRVVKDKIAWTLDPSPTPFETAARGFTSSTWDISSQNSRGEKIQDYSSRKEVATPPGAHVVVQAAKRAELPASTLGMKKKWVSTQAQDTRDTDRSKLHATDNTGPPASSRAERKWKKGKRQETTASVTAKEVNSRHSTGNVADKEPGQLKGASARKRQKRKRKTTVQKVMEAPIARRTKNKMNDKQPEAQEVMDATAPTVTEKQHVGELQIKAQKVTDMTITTMVKKAGTKKGQPKTTGTAQTGDSSKVHASLLDLVKETVCKYRMQSAVHFVLHIDVQLSDTDPRQKETRSRCKLNIAFQNYNQEIHWICKRAFQKGRSTREVLVCTGRVLVPLFKMLAEQFPVSEVITSQETLMAYWESNGKSFNWTALPTELKEHILQFCIVSAPLHTDRFHDIAHPPRFGRVIKSRSCELIDRLGQWKDLLSVSTQVRTITLRLCFNGSLFFDEGICVTSYNLFDFATRLSRLEGYSQITEPNSVPLTPDDPGHLLMKVYRNTPKLYPELKRYATFAQGIRKIDLSFDFVEFYRFFKVTEGGFDSVEDTGRAYACDLEKLPFLNSIVIRLPHNRKKDWRNKPYQAERPLFHATFPCPRMIFRLLYERIAKVLAAYEDVSVRNFLDKSEEERFWGLRQAAMKALQDLDLPKPVKLTIEELKELSVQDVGGLQLSKEERMWIHREKRGEYISKEEKEIEEPVTVHFYPIHCGCTVSCREQYDFRPGW